MKLLIRQITLLGPVRNPFHTNVMDAADITPRLCSSRGRFIVSTFHSYEEGGWLGFSSWLSIYVVADRT